MDSTVVRAACPHDCPDTCAIRVTVHEGRAVKVQGDPDHPPTHGALCTKVSRYPERSYHPERVLQPLRRIGPKGSGRFEPVSWTTALGDIAARLKAMNLDHVLVIADEVNENLFLAARNLPNVLVVEPRYADPLSLVFYKKVVVTKGAIAKLQEMFA